MLNVEKTTQNKNDSINWILQYGRVANKNRCLVLTGSGFPYLILSQTVQKKDNYHLLSYMD